jgi:hypothetical protein
MSVDRNWSNKLPVSDAIGSRALRRRKVVALFGGYALMGVTALGIMAQPAEPVRIAVGLIFIAVTLASLWGWVSLLGRTAINAPNISADAFDERQLARRNEAFSRTQPALGFSIAACALYALAAWVMPQLRAPGLMVYLLYGLLILSATLPTAYLAWTEADPEPRDDA